MDQSSAEMIAKDLVRALRGRRSRAAFSRRLGYHSNVVHRWETGAGFPATDEFLTRLAQHEPSLAGVLDRFVGRNVQTEQFGVEPVAVAAFLRELQGKTPASTLARQAGYSRFQVGRWLSGRARPRLPDFLCLVEAASRRLLDLLALLVDPQHMPTVAPRYRALLAARDAAYEAPFSHAVLRALELRDYPQSPRPLWIAKRLGVPVAEVEACLAQLLASKQVRRVRGGYRPARVQMVDTRADPLRARRLKAHWARTAVDRLEAGAAGSFGYSLFAVSRADLARLRALHMEYVRAMQSVIAESSEPECVGLYCSQLLDLADSAQTDGHVQDPARPRLKATPTR